MNPANFAGLHPSFVTGHGVVVRHIQDAIRNVTVIIAQHLFRAH
tara:strand:+ start:1632 stop:1763 length:132 start_codon:yes stop_codon:yes gene_type:complete